jgi:hypothetical protein
MRLPCDASRYAQERGDLQRALEKRAAGSGQALEDKAMQEVANSRPRDAVSLPTPTLTFRSLCAGCCAPLAATREPGGKLGRRKSSTARGLAPAPFDIYVTEM